jgi:hypothetical protein
MIKIFSIILIIGLKLSAHTLLMNVFDNEDNTITVSGAFSTGQPAVGAMVRLEALNTAQILYKKRLPENSELSITIPSEPYQIVLDGGPGHQIVKDGIAPKGGFKVSLKQNETSKKELSEERSFTKKWSLPYIILISAILLLIVLTIYFSKRNTNKILQAIKEHNNG